MPSLKTESGQISSEKRPGRLRAAWRVLRGQALVPSQIEWEWLEYKLHFNGLLERYSALLARDARRLKAEQQDEPQPSRPPLSPLRARHQAKAELTSRVLSLRANSSRSQPQQLELSGQASAEPLASHPEGERTG